jgi:integrase/recombinase XerC
MIRRGLAAGTRYARTRIVRRWFGYLDVAGVGFASARLADVDGFVDELGGGARYRYCAVSHLHQFYIWARRYGHSSADPTELVERPRLPVRLPRPLNAAQVGAALADADPITTIMICLMADAGLRCCEVAALCWSDIDHTSGTLRVSGKGNRERIVGIPQRLAGALRAVDGLAGPVTGRTLAAHRVSQLVGAHLRAAGVAATAHQLRHSYATRLYAATGGDLLAVQQALGHASVMSTQGYAAIDPGRAVAVARRLEP